MLSFTDARSLILDHCQTVGIEQYTLPDAAGRILASDVTAPWNLPMWDNSAMDGYAVRHEDCVAVPARLRVTGYLAAGATSLGVSVRPGCAIKIMTGAPMPEDADAVVPVEDTDETSGEEVTIRKQVSSGQHIRKQGEDIRSGSRVIAAGTLLRPPEIAVLASLGCCITGVFRRPQVAILATGDELVEPGQIPGKGQIVNCNAVALAAAVAGAGGIPRLIGIARDNREDHLKKIRDGLQADVLITSAGISAGDRDLVRVILEELGAKLLFWKVGIKPGKPTAFAICNGTPIFALPGNPVSTLISFEEFVRPALMKMAGCREILPRMFQAALAEDIRHRPSDRLCFLRVRIENRDGRWYAASSGNQQAGIIASFLATNAIAHIPPGQEFLNAGDRIDVHWYDSTAEWIAP